ncbi:MAG: hypothetical protein ROO76_04900 [Terriglobia bacterium]|jgi:hypothetical protein|nr:hypothetical protein [Terriglobia bacterium]
MSTTNINTKNFTPPAILTEVRTMALFAALAGGVALVIAGFLNFPEFLRGYLIAYMFVLGLSLGGMALLMTGHLTGGNWWMLGRRIFEAAARCVPMLAILFLPILLGAKQLYPWMTVNLATDKMLAEKAWWLNYPWWIGRAIIYFALWILLSIFLTRLSWRQDESASPSIWRTLKVISGIGILVWAWSLTGAVVDWGMSLDPHWYSTIYGMIFMIGEALSMMALTIIFLSVLSKYSPMDEVVLPDRLHDVGKLLLAFTMVWAYFSFSQWLIIWMGNLPDEISWYLHRIKSGWGYIALLLIFVQFALPFALLLSRDLKRKPQKLIPVAIIVMLGRWIDMYWYFVPNSLPGGTPPSLHFHWSYIAAIVGLGGIWVAAFCTFLGKKPLLVRNEPMLPRLWEPSHGH